MGTSFSQLFRPQILVFSFILLLVSRSTVTVFPKYIQSLTASHPLSCCRRMQATIICHVLSIFGLVVCFSYQPKWCVYDSSQIMSFLYSTLPPPVVSYVFKQYASLWGPPKIFGTPPLTHYIHPSYMVLLAVLRTHDQFLPQGLCTCYPFGLDNFPGHCIPYSLTPVLCSQVTW